MQKSLFITILVFTTPYMIHFLSAINYYWDYLENAFEPDTSSELYDFIVVGAGSSGAVVAHRLAQYHKVLLIEAGGDPIFLSSIPAFAMDLLGYEEHDWNYRSVKQKNVAFSHRDQKFTHHRGKVLGGSSTLNYMLYLRGNSLDYDNWANITKDPDWKYENVLPFFKKSIKEYHGQFKEKKKHYEPSPYGFLTVGLMQWERMSSIFNEAGKELGYNSNIDANGPQTSGTGNVEVTQHFGERHSTYASILRGNRNKNLRISKYSQATKIKIDKNGRATGVWYYRHGKKYFARASKEVISSAGAIDSPKLLMLSGIGPKEELEKLKIKSKADLPVGKNLQDHFGILLFPFITKESTSFIYERDLNIAGFYEYFTKGTGILTAPTAMVAQFFMSTSKTKGVDWPDIQTFFIPVGPSQMLIESFSRALSLEKDLLIELFQQNLGKDGFTLFPIVSRPRSLGEVTLKDKNPFSDPLIDPRPFSHPDDMRIMLEGINESINLVEKSKSFKTVDAKYAAPHITPCTMHAFRSDAYWECYVRHAPLHIWHPVGTCKMSHSKDSSAVVDSKLRVLKTKSLRVIDASLMPVIVNANTNAPTIMIGEKGADMILEYWTMQRLVCDRLERFKYSDTSKCYYR